MAQRWQIDTDEMIEFTQELVRIRSVFDSEQQTTEADAAYAVAAKMRSWGWDPQIVEVAPNRPNVIAVLDGSGPGPTLMFEGHTDVVTEGDLSEWTFDPYAAEIRDGRMLGRGTADMKAGIAAMLYAARAVEQAGFTGRIVLGALADEEGMMLGAKHFAQTELAKTIDGVIVCEPEDYEVCAVAKGAIRLRVTVHGKMAHGAMPQKGRNPVPVAARMIVALGDLQARLQERNGEHDLVGFDYLTATEIHAGDADQMNVIPRVCSFSVDIRTTPMTSHEDLRFDLQQTLEDIALGGDVKVELDFIDDRPPVDTPHDAGVVAALVEAHVNVVGTPARFGGVPGTTDGTILTRDAALHSVVYGPGDKWIAHQADEWVGVDDIATCAQVYAETARIFLAKESTR